MVFSFFFFFPIFLSPRSSLPNHIHQLCPRQMGALRIEMVGLPTAVAPEQLHMHRRMAVIISASPLTGNDWPAARS